MRQIQRTFLVRKLTPIIVAVCVFFMFMPTSLAVEGETGTDLGYSWCELVDGTVEITGYTGAPGDITIPTTLSGKTVSAIGEAAFKFNTIFQQSVTIPGSIKTIKKEAFRGLIVTDIIIQDGVETIGENAFTQCTNITQITLPGSIKTMGAQAFFACSSLTDLTIKEGVKSTGIEAFHACTALENISLPSTLETIEKQAFIKCEKLASITIPGRVNTIGESAFQWCNKLTSITIESGVKTVGPMSFSECDELTNITIPDTVTTIQQYAFSGCDKLKEVTINGSTSIGQEAFTCCLLLDTLVMPKVTSFGERAFQNCTALEVITIPGSVTSIGNHAFNGCTALLNFTIPSSVKSIGEFAFTGCNKLTDMTIPSSVTSIPKGLFDSCELLEKVTIPNSVKSIGEEAFFRCYALKQITLPITLSSIGPKAFAQSGLTQITIPDTVTSIGAFAFSETSIKNVTIPDSLKVIDEGVFGACVQLDSVTIPDSITSICAMAFAYCPLLTEITIPSSVTSIGDKSFWNTGLNKITVLNPNASFGTEVFLDTTLSDGIYGFGTSTAETYATDNSIPFHVLCTVTFDTDGGSEISDIYPIPGEKINAPEIPIKEGYTFEGWFKEKACQNAWNFDTDTVPGDLTLYAKWEVIPQPTPEPTPEPTPNPDTKLITVTGTLLGDDGKPLAGYTVELHSTPRTTVTDSKGKYTFENVEVANHSLTLKDKSGTTLKSFAIAVQSGDDFTWSKPDDDSITAVVQEDTASIDVTINITSDGKVTVDKIENVVNPQTGDVQQSLVWVLAIIGVLVICTTLIHRKQTA